MKIPDDHFTETSSLSNMITEVLRGQTPEYNQRIHIESVILSYKVDRGRKSIT